jgi:hypothetical protein
MRRGVHLKLAREAGRKPNADYRPAYFGVEVVLASSSCGSSLVVVVRIVGAGIGMGGEVADDDGMRKMRTMIVGDDLQSHRRLSSIVSRLCCIR